MEVAAKLRYARISPQKCRLVADQIRGLSVAQALKILAFSRKKAARMVHKVLESAIANARVKADKTAERFDERELVVASAFIDEGPTMKRFRPRAQGRAGRINKRTSHITVVVAPKPAKATNGGNR